jgi:hypothetical protein
MNGSVTGGIPVSAKRRGYVLTAGVLLVMMLGGTLPVPLYVLWEKQMGFGPLGVTVVFAAYVVGTLAALLVLGDLSDHVGRRIVLAIARPRAADRGPVCRVCAHAHPQRVLGLPGPVRAGARRAHGYPRDGP